MSYLCQKTQKWLCLPRTGVPPSTRSRCPSWERWLMPVRNWDRTGCPTSTLTPSVSHRPAPVPLSHPHHQKKYPPGNWFVRRKRNLHPPTNQSVSRKKLNKVYVSHLDIHVCNFWMWSCFQSACICQWCSFISDVATPEPPKPIQCLEIKSPFLNYKVSPFPIPTDT